MAIQQVGGQGVYVITGSGRDPRRTTNGQSWADLVTKQKYMLYKSAYDQAMREYNQGLISEKQRREKMQLIQQQIDAERSAIDKLKLKQLDLNQARQIENQRMKAKASLTTVTRGDVSTGTKGKKGQKIPSKSEYLGDLRNESRDINTDNARLQTMATGLATEIPKLQAMADSGQPMFQFLQNAETEQELQYNNIIQQLQDNRTRQGEITTEIGKVQPFSPDEYVEHYKTQVGLPIEVGGTEDTRTGDGKRTTSRYYREPVQELGGVSLQPQVDLKEERIRKLQEEMAALGVTPNVDVIDRTREIYADKFGQPVRRRRRLLDRFGREQVVEEPVDEVVDTPVQNDMSRFQQPNLTSQIANRSLANRSLTNVEQPTQQPVRTQTFTPEQQVEQEILGVSPTPQNYQEEFDSTGQFAESVPVEQEILQSPQTEEEMEMDRFSESVDEERIRQQAAENAPMDFIENRIPTVGQTMLDQTLERYRPQMYQEQTPVDIEVTPDMTEEQVTDFLPTGQIDMFAEPAPAPTPTPMSRVKILGRIPYMEDKQEIITKDPITSAFDSVRNQGVMQKQRVALQLLQQAKEAYGVSSKEYKKTKDKILMEMVKAIDPKKSRQMRQVKALQKSKPGQYYRFGEEIRGLNKDSQSLVLSLFPVNDDTKTEDIERLYKNAQQQIKLGINNTTQKRKALDMLDLMYLAVITDKR